MLYGSREDDLCLRLAKMLKFIDKMIQLLGGLKNDFDQHRIFTSNAIAFNHIGNGLDTAGEERNTSLAISLMGVRAFSCKIFNILRSIVSNFISMETPSFYKHKFTSIEKKSQP